MFCLFFLQVRTLHSVRYVRHCTASTVVPKYSPHLVRVGASNFRVTLVEVVTLHAIFLLQSMMTDAKIIQYSNTTRKILLIRLVKISEKWETWQVRISSAQPFIRLQETIRKVRKKGKNEPMWRSSGWVGGWVGIGEWRPSVWRCGGVCARDVNSNVGGGAQLKWNWNTEMNGMNLHWTGWTCRSTGSFTDSTSSFIVQVGLFRSFHVPFQSKPAGIVEWWNGIVKWNRWNGMVEWNGGME